MGINLVHMSEVKTFWENGTFGKFVYMLFFFFFAFSVEYCVIVHTEGKLFPVSQSPQAIKGFG